MPPPPKNMRKVLLQLRENLEINQYQFAKLVGVAPNTVKNWEIGVIKSLSTKTQHKLQQALQLTDDEVLRYFFRGEIPPVKSKPASRTAA